MSDWIKLDPQEINKATSEKIKGVQVELYLAPFQIPSAVQGRFDDAANKFLIEFQYPGAGESTSIEDHGDSKFVSVEVGRVSRRIYKIWVDVKKAGFHFVGLSLKKDDIRRIQSEVEHVLPGLQSQGLVSEDNSMVAAAILRKKSTRLFEQEMR